MAETDKITAACKEELNKNPDDTDALHQLGHGYMCSQKYEQAIEIFQKIVDIDPENTEAWFLLFAAYKESAQETEAAKILSAIIDNLRQRVDADPQDLESWGDLGFAYSLCGKHGKIAEVYKRLKSLDSNYAEEFRKRLSEL